MENFPGIDRHTLMNKAYATDEALVIRQRTHELYSVPRLNFSEWVLDHIQWQGNETVLDVGAGPGTYFYDTLRRIPHGKLVACDLSLGMAKAAAAGQQDATILNGDVQTLPFRDHSFDVVLANHMLYHVPDLEGALEEIHRVLKPTGCMIAATNSQFNMPEFEQLFRRTYGLLGAIGPDIEAMRPISWRFQLEDGPVKVARHFRGVARYDLPAAFIFPDVQPAIDYINSMRALREPQLPRRVSWDDFISVLSDQIQRLINHFGELVVNKLSGVIVGTDAGGFIKDFAEIEEKLNQ